MGDIFTPLDVVIFFAALLGVMAVGLYAGRQEETSEDYFLAGHTIPWWGVAGSIFGSNVSANHMVGMMGIGFSIGFAQSHFELGAIFGLMVLCYGFLPAYRKLNVYTLSEYLGRRYDDRSRIAYAVIIVIIMAIVQMVPGLYIGARSACVLMGGKAAVEVSGEKIERVADLPGLPNETPEAARLLRSSRAAESRHQPPADEFKVEPRYYAAFVIALAVVAAAYTIFGGLKAVIWTDMIQSVLLLAAGILLAVITFQRIGGWGAMMSLDAAANAPKMRLYLPTNDPDLPWTGVFTGLIAMHCFYWGTNQFIVQRALAARDDREGRMGIVAAGFLKLLIPFFAIAAGVAAFYLFQRELPNRSIDPDTAFTELVKLVVLPMGPGLVGLIAAGLIGAILSSLDSMMNSAATIVTIDIYKKYVNPNASDRQMIFAGRVSIAIFVSLAALMAIYVLDPNSKANFFLKIADYQNYLTPGLLVAFIMGMFWRKGTATAAFVTIIAGVVFSWGLESAYNRVQGMNPAAYRIVTAAPEKREEVLLRTKVADLPKNTKWESLAQVQDYVQQQQSRLTPVNRLLGAKLNFFHRVVGVIGLCIAVYVAVSLPGRPDPEKARLVWTDLGGHAPQDLRDLLAAITVSICVFTLLGWLMVIEKLSPETAAWLAAAWTLSMYLRGIRRRWKNQQADDDVAAVGPLRVILADDRFWAGILCAAAVFMHFYFY